MASRASSYCRIEKIKVTLSVTPAAASSSTASKPAGVAGTLIMRFWCPADHFLPSSMYCATRARMGNVGVRVFQQRIEFEADVAVVALGLLPDGQEHRLGLAHQRVGQAARRFRSSS